MSKRYREEARIPNVAEREYLRSLLTGQSPERDPETGVPLFNADYEAGKQAGIAMTVFWLFIGGPALALPLVLAQEYWWVAALVEAGIAWGIWYWRHGR